MDSAAIVWPLFNSLQAFWPGLQVTHQIFLFCFRLMPSVIAKCFYFILKGFSRRPQSGHQDTFSLL